MSTPSPTPPPALHQARFSRLAFRTPNAQPVPGWPVAVRSVGHAVLKAGFTDRRKRRNRLMVLWSLAGCGRCTFAGTGHDLPPGTWTWLPPATTYTLAATSSRWEIRWLTIDGPAIAAWTAGWQPPPAPCRPAVPLDLATHDWLLASVCEPTRERLLACLDRSAALLSAGLHGGGETDLVDRGLALIDRHHADPDFDVAALARLLGCHRSHLGRCFTARTGVGPGEHLRQRRVRHAQDELLADPRAGLRTIAAASGFAGPDQLSRAFRHVCGLPPGAWRRRGAPAW